MDSTDSTVSTNKMGMGTSPFEVTGQRQMGPGPISYHPNAMNRGQWISQHGPTGITTKQMCKYERNISQ
jgi:hypothetical protein